MSIGQSEAAIPEYARGFQMIDDGHPDVASSRFAANWLPWAHYNMACALAASGEEPAALGHLRQAIDAGFSDAERMDNDPELAMLRGTAEWSDMMQLIEG